MNTKLERRRSALGLVAAGTLLVMSTSGLAQDSGSVEEGARVYGDVCGTCHNPRSPLERSDRDWVTIVNHMRVRANMSGQQSRDVLAFLQATNQDPRQEASVPETGASGAGELQADTVAQGKRLVSEKACLGCHIIGDGGGNIGPELNGVVNRKGADAVSRKITDPTFDNSTSMMPNFGLSEEEAGWITAYLATLNDN